MLDARCRAVLDAANDGWWEANLATGSFRLNAGAVELLGHAAANAPTTLDQWRALVHPDDLPRAEAEWNGYVAGAQPLYRVELRLRTGSGEWRWILVRTRCPHVDRGPGRALVIGSLTDISTARQVESALESASRALRIRAECNRRLMQATDDHAFLAGICAVLVEVGGYRTAWIAGKRPGTDELEITAHAGAGDGRLAERQRAHAGRVGLGQTNRCLERGRPIVCRDIRTDAALARWSDAVLDAASGGLIAVPLRAAGLTFAALNLHSAEPNAFSPDEIHLLTLLADDVAVALTALASRRQRDEAEDRLRESESRLRTVLETYPDAVFVQTDGRFAYANPAALALFGAGAPRELLHTPVLDRVRADFRDATAARVRQTNEQRLAYRRLESTWLRLDGAEIEVEVAAVPFVFNGRRGALVSARDITERKAMEQHLLHAKRMESIGTLAGGVAHDLNNILAPILLVAPLLQDRVASDSDRELLQMAYASAKRGADVVRQLLTFSRGQEGKRISLQPRHLLKEIVSIMRETFPRDLALQSRVAADLWTIVGDPTQVHQVVLNLGVNARDAMPNGGTLTISAANRAIPADDPALPPGIAPGNFVIIEVRDTGIGMTAEVRSRIFDPFFTTKPAGSGTGLGLSTALGIVRSHGGFIAVESAPGQGSTFRVYLPAVIGDAKEPATDTPSEPERSPATAAGILVVDDELAIRETTRCLLERNHYRVLTATDGLDALRTFLANRPDIQLVLTDVMMPGLNGLALIRSLAAIDPRLKIIATTGVLESPQQLEIQASGVPVLPKPMEGGALLAAVRRALEDGSTPPTGATR